MNTVVAMETASKCARWEIKDARDVDLAVFLDVHFALLLQGMMCSGGEEDNLCPRRLRGDLRRFFSTRVAWLYELTAPFEWRLGRMERGK